jgi:Uma2 family endonuclease
MTTTDTTITLEAFLALPEEKPALEYEDGVVTQKVSPKGRHSALQVGIAEQINRQVRPGKLGKAFTELRATYETLSRVPDDRRLRWTASTGRGREIVDDFFGPARYCDRDHPAGPVGEPDDPALSDLRSCRGAHRHSRRPNGSIGGG